MVKKYVGFIMLIILFSSCSQKEFNQRSDIIEDVKIIKKQLNEINIKTNSIDYAYENLNNYYNHLLVELNNSNNQNKFILELNNELVLFKNKIFDIQNQLDIINKNLIKSSYSNKESDTKIIKQEVLLIKENLLKINENYMNQILLLESQNMNLLQAYANTYEKKNLYLEKEIENINNQLKVIENNIITFNNYLKNNKSNEKQIKSEFLIALIGLYGAIIAFLIPHGIDMVFKIGKLYESEAIANLFRKEAYVNTLYINLITAIIVNIFFVILYDYIPFYLLIFPIVYFLIIMCCIANYIGKLNLYTNTDAVLNIIQRNIVNEIQ